jgi:hypothetical protein
VRACAPGRGAGDEGFEFADQLAVASEGEVGLDPLFERADASFLQPRGGRDREALRLEVGERRATPERERLAEAIGCAFGIRRP